MTDSNAPEPQSSGEVGWGILATGGIARMFARDLATHGHRIAAVGSRTPESARRFADEFDIPAAHGSYADLVADPQVDIVYVATPHHLHMSNACDALAAGKHVLVEKAFTLNADEARTVVELGRERGLLVMEAMWTRFLPHMALVREVIASGRIGEVRSLHADHTQDLPTEPTHRLNDLALGGGALLDLGVYPLSFAHDLLGPPTKVMAHGVLGPTGADVRGDDPRPRQRGRFDLVLLAAYPRPQPCRRAGHRGAHRDRRGLVHPDRGHRPRREGPARGTLRAIGIRTRYAVPGRRGRAAARGRRTRQPAHDARGLGCRDDDHGSGPCRHRVALSQRATRDPKRPMRDATMSADRRFPLVR
jgi:hypothetical protein